MIPLNLPAQLSFIEPLATNMGFNGVGFQPTTSPLSFAKYQNWIASGFHGEMLYLKNHLPKKESLKQINPQINSILSLTHPYRVLTNENKPVFSSLKIALYAQDEDYHDWLKKKLELLIVELQKQFPNEFFLPATDIFPILERDFAYQNRLGWIGKNSCLIKQTTGSLFLIGNILSSLSLTTSESPPIHDFCGKCTKCIESCPTQAITSERTLDAKKCISYWTIEAKQIAPKELRSQFTDHFFGCDICQTVCPWNGKVLQTLHNEKPNFNSSENLIAELKFILTASPEDLKRKTNKTALYRSKAFGLKRNALIIIGNLKIKELKTEVMALKETEALAELVTWTLAELA